MTSPTATQSFQQCQACARSTPHALRFTKNGCDIWQCRQCGLGHTHVAAFDPKAYYTEDYFSGGHADGYSDYRAAEPVLRREFARSVDFIRRYRDGGKLLELHREWAIIEMAGSGSRRVFERRGLQAAKLVLPWEEGSHPVAQ